jgi:hypothetical protein
LSSNENSKLNIAGHTKSLWHNEYDTEIANLSSCRKQLISGRAKSLPSFLKSSHYKTKSFSNYDFTSMHNMIAFGETTTL